MMVIEIAGGWWFNSMAVLADGWHMSSHSLALGLSAFAYAFARRHAGNRRYAFGTWKVEVLGSYTSAILLLGIAALMVFQSVERLMRPQTIHYDEAIAIAVVGLAVNLVCAWWLRGHHHGHDHEHGGITTSMGRARARASPGSQCALRLPTRAGGCGDFGTGHHGAARRQVVGTGAGWIPSWAWPARC